jgi:hypothetical protein
MYTQCIVQCVNVNIYIVSSTIIVLYINSTIKVQNRFSTNIVQYISNLQE